MKKIFLLLCLFICGCVQAPYQLKVENDLAQYHGQSVYFRTNMRSSYAIEIRRLLSRKFGELGLKTATSAENAELIAIFDVETFYKQENAYKNTSYLNTADDSVLFTDDEEGNSLGFSGNANYIPTKNQTCFSLNVGEKGTSFAQYRSMFCASEIMETEQMLPLIIDVYEQYATYQYINVGIQCFIAKVGSSANCGTANKQNSFAGAALVDRYIVNN